MDSVQELQRAGFSVGAIRSSGYSEEDLLQLEEPNKEGRLLRLLENCVSNQQVKQNIGKLDKCKIRRLGVHELRRIGFLPSELTGWFSAKELEQSGFFG